MLVASLKIKVGATAEPRVNFDYCCMAHSRVKPDVENIFLFEKIPFAAPWTGKTSGHEFNDRPGKPRIRTFSLNDGGDVFADILRENSFIAFLQ